MNFFSVCSGIDSASVAWTPLGWRCIGLSEIEAFPRAVLSHHYPDVPLHGDFVALVDAPPVGADVLVGGTPCQSFSLAGGRAGLEDERGNLALQFVRMADAIDDARRRDGRPPAVIVWENVPGVFSVKGNAFGCFLGALVGEDSPIKPHGGKWTDAGLVVGPSRAAAWRVLDAQYFRLAQRRERVFVVASARAGFDPSAVLFEPEGVRRHSPPSREAGAGVARPIAAGTTGGGGYRHDADTADSLIVGAVRASDGGGDVIHAQSGHLVAFGGNNTAGPIDVATACNAHGVRQDFETETFITFDSTQITHPENRSNPQPGDPCHPLAAAGHPPTIAGRHVRRLTPLECERLQGFPDGYTDIPWKRRNWTPDGPRYAALGNSMAVPVMRWIGERIDMVEKLK